MLQKIPSDQQIVLVGESAGGSMAIAMYADNAESIDRVVTIAGKNHGANNVSESIYRKNPAFRESLNNADKALSKMSANRRARIHTIFSERDGVVGANDSLISGSPHTKVDIAGHARTVLFVITFRFPLISRIVPRKS